MPIFIFPPCAENSTEIHKLLLSGSPALLEGVCSAMCGRKNKPGNDHRACVAFSSNVTEDFTCRLYSDVAFVKSASGNTRPKEKLYHK